MKMRYILFILLVVGSLNANSQYATQAEAIDAAKSVFNDYKGFFLYKNPASYQPTISAGSVDIQDYMDITIVANNQQLINVNSTILTGTDIVMIRAIGGVDNKYIEVVGTGNISLNSFAKNGRIVLRNGDALLIRRTTSAGTWIVISAPYQPSYTSVPISGYFLAGETFRKNSTTVGDNTGWTVTTAGYTGADYNGSGSYIQGNSVKVGNNVYIATTSGNAANNTPSGTGTTVDGGVTWQYSGTLAIFTATGAPSGGGGGGGTTAREFFTATSNQTAFTVSGTLPTNIAQVHVYIFGVKYFNFTISGNTVTSTVPRDLNDKFVIEY